MDSDVPRSADPETRLAVELQTLMRRGVSVTLELSPPDAYAVVGLLQMALRHPQIPPYPAHVARAVVDQIAYAFADAPFVRTTIAQGYDPAYDVPPGRNGEDR